MHLLRCATRVLLILAVSFCLCETTYGQTAGHFGQGICDDNGKARKCDGFALINEAGLPLQEMWGNKNFEGIDQQFRDWCTGKERFPDGRWKLVAFEDSFSSMFRAWKQWDKDQKRLQDWKLNSPDSLSEALVEVIFWRSYAWNARGGGFANTVSKDGFELFNERLEKARVLLKASERQSQSCPLWHSLMLDTLLESGHDIRELESAYRVGFKLFPDYNPIHFAMGRAYSPRWGGDEIAFDRFARGATSITKKTEGNGLYAQLYWTQDGNGQNMIQFSNASKTPDWNLIKSGFEDMMKRYPESTWNMNKFASFACRANDKETYQKLRRQLGSIINSELWPTSYSVDVCDHRFFKPV